jgi:hypothetical protein
MKTSQTQRMLSVIMILFLFYFVHSNKIRKHQNTIDCEGAAKWSSDIAFGRTAPWTYVGGQEVTWNGKKFRSMWGGQETPGASECFSQSECANKGKQWITIGVCKEATIKVRGFIKNALNGSLITDAEVFGGKIKISFVSNDGKIYEAKLVGNGIYEVVLPRGQYFRKAQSFWFSENNGFSGLSSNSNESDFSNTLFLNPSNNYGNWGNNSGNNNANWNTNNNDKSNTKNNNKNNNKISNKVTGGNNQNNIHINVNIPDYLLPKNANKKENTKQEAQKKENTKQEAAPKKESSKTKETIKDQTPKNNNKQEDAPKKDSIENLISGFGKFEISGKITANGAATSTSELK